MAKVERAQPARDPFVKRVELAAGMLDVWNPRSLQDAAMVADLLERIAEDGEAHVAKLAELPGFIGLSLWMSLSSRGLNAIKELSAHYDRAGSEGDLRSRALLFDLGRKLRHSVDRIGAVSWKPLRRAQ